jgi:hypothetical protein
MRGRITRAGGLDPLRLAKNGRMDGERILCGDRLKMMRGQRQLGLGVWP